MSNNISMLLKAINFMNKKVSIPAFDDYIYIENGMFILVDAFKIYTLSNELIKDIGNYCFEKSELIKVKGTGVKIFFNTIENDILTLDVHKKETVKQIHIHLTKRSLNIMDIVKKDLSCENLICTNGINLRNTLKGYKDNLTLSFKDEKAHILMGEEESSIDFNEAFGEVCSFDIIKSDSALAEIVGQNIADAIGQFGLVKKNSTIYLSFNSNCFMVSNSFDNQTIEIYLFTNKI